MSKTKKINIGLLHTMIRGDEKLLIEAANQRDVNMEIIDIRSQVFNPAVFTNTYDVLLERCVSTVLGMHAIEFFESMGVPVVNSLAVARICENKFATSLILQKEKIPTPPFALVFSEEQAKKAVEQLGGFPVVLKPVSGSWGRLITRINDIHALEGVIEQKIVLGGPHHHALYLQKYVEKPGRDIRIHIIGGKVIGAIYRQSAHWITNTARGALPLPCAIDSDLERIAQKTGNAIGSGVLGIDVFETPNGYVVNEVNHTMEFKNVQRVTEIDVAGEIIDYCLKVSK